MREASHPSTDILDLNIRWKPSPHEPRQAEADKLGAQTHFAQATGLLRLSGAIGQLLLDSPVWWFEPAQSQLRRQIIHHSCKLPVKAHFCDDHHIVTVGFGHGQRHMFARLDYIELSWKQHHESTRMANATGDPSGKRNR
jgi:hypothetical protein